jgi:hypothetical protein
MSVNRTAHFEKYCPLKYVACVKTIHLMRKVDEIISLHDSPVADSRLRLELMKFSNLKGADCYQLQHIDMKLTAIESSSLISQVIAIRISILFVVRQSLLAAVIM